MDMPTRRILYRLLYYTLVEIREEGYTSKNKVVFHLADLMHRIPLQIERMERGEISPEEVMQSLQAHAHEKGFEEWLKRAIKDETKFVQSNPV